MSNKLCVCCHMCVLLWSCFCHVNVELLPVHLWSFNYFYMWSSYRKLCVLSRQGIVRSLGVAKDFPIMRSCNFLCEYYVNEQTNKSVFVSELQVTKPKWDDFAGSSLQKRHIYIYMYIYIYVHVYMYMYMSIFPPSSLLPPPSCRSKSELQYHVFVCDYTVRTCGREAFWQS